MVYDCATNDVKVLFTMIFSSPKSVSHLTARESCNNAKLRIRNP